jgi:hypothetical protein
MNITKHNLSALTIAILATFTASTKAAVITQTFSVGSEATVNGSTATPSTTNTANYKSSNSFVGIESSSANGFAFANSNGAYAVTSSAEGSSANARGDASLTYRFLNNSAVTQDLSLSFKIYGGSISTSLSSGQILTGLETLQTSYSASITANGASLFASSATITRTASGIQATNLGFDLSKGADNGNDGVYTWSSYSDTYSLGPVIAGGVVDVVAMLQQSTLSQVGTYSFDCGGGGYEGYEGYNPTLVDSPQLAAVAQLAKTTTTCSGFKGSAYGFYGDPTTLNGSTGAGSPVFAFSFSPSSASVPVPGSLALGALGLVAMLRFKRKNQNLSH